MNPQKQILFKSANILSSVRDSIDKQLLQIKDYLELAGVGYRGKLIDDEGYPLPDIDHYKVLSQRQHAARLLNDRKRIEFIIDNLTQTEGNTADGNPPLYLELEKLKPFSIIDEVHSNSPAEKGDLRNGDFILQFGDAKKMFDIPKQIVEGNPVVVKIYRVAPEGRNIIEITITPEKWSGQGLVGAHLLPFIE
ncbi:26S proteasome non-ATPase regulatory subunit 9 [Histomonas meleagridis]|uniref:26S proteasome non-ATPase regulatory subunit 9 n=1 Tax=Histomonas meleagridis TaxID=135588 RepID=UPI00355A9EB9|nr:26S proteasome non-ATPase regulatory subunit 9 [Histomonas meleagridis]KAH0798612.1 26S proteasome non-ATPase regulatory subunit 9 [Histomonas meleagridis]